MGQLFDLVRAIDELKKYNKIAHIDWGHDEYCALGPDGSIYDSDGDLSGFYVPCDGLIANVWKVYDEAPFSIVNGPLELIKSLKSGAWKYATIIEDGSLEDDHKIIFDGDEGLIWEGRSDIPMTEKFLKAKYQLHK